MMAASRTVVRKNRKALEYTGKHRENEMPKGVGLIPLGDRNRARFDSDGIEERNCLGQYDKFLK